MDLKQFSSGLRYFNAKNVTDGDYKIENVETQELNGKPVAVLLFSNDPRAFRMKPSQVSELIRRFGPDSEEWKGKAVRLSRDEDGRGVHISPAKLA